jgi:PAS domain S-box-containing protein
MNCNLWQWGSAHVSGKYKYRKRRIIPIFESGEGKRVASGSSGCHAIPKPFLVINASDYSVEMANSTAAPKGLSGGVTCHFLTRRLSSPCDSTDDYRCPLKEVVKTKKPAVIRQTEPDRSGNRKVIEVHCCPILDNTGNVKHVIETISDITDRCRAEAILREKEEKFRIIADSANDAVIMMDHEGKASFWNKAAAKIFGCSEAEVLGKDIHRLIAPKAYIDVFRDKFPGFQETGGGNAIGKTLELMAIRKDGTEFPIEMSLSSMEINNKWQAVAIIRDISERKQAEENIKRIVNQYTAMINTVPAIMYIKDKDHSYVEVNKAFCDFVGKSHDEIIGRTVYELFPPDKAEEYYQADLIVMNENKAVSNSEEIITDADGRLKWIAITKAPLHDNRGHVAGVVGLTQDVTEQHLNREQLMQSDKLAAIGTLAAGVAHEINNPMGYISSNLNTMGKYVKKTQDYINGTDDQRKNDKESINEIITDFKDAIEESLEGADRVKKIVADLKSFSRVDRAEKGYANINTGLKSTLNIVWNELKYKCTVEKDLGELPELYCIANQINQVFMNLLMNAGQAIKESGTISLKTRADQGNIHVSIKDNGSGIPKKNLERIFEPFFTTKEVGSGTGLGLSLAYDIIQKHGGDIDVKSEVGIGTEFIITLPLTGLLEKQNA